MVSGKYWFKVHLLVIAKASARKDNVFWYTAFRIYEEISTTVIWEAFSLRQKISMVRKWFSQTSCYRKVFSGWCFIVHYALEYKSFSSQVILRVRKRPKQLSSRKWKLRTFRATSFHLVKQWSAIPCSGYSVLFMNYCWGKSKLHVGGRIGNLLLLMWDKPQDTLSNKLVPLDLKAFYWTQTIKSDVV